MKDTFYFQHDYNSRNDDKILVLRDKYKNEGYAVYFYCLETMAERGDGYIIPSLIGGLSLGYGVTKELLLEFLEVCVNIEILKKDKKGYYSQRMIQHLKNRKEKRYQQSLAGKVGMEKRWHKCYEQNDITSDITSDMRDDITKHNIVKNSIVKNNILLPDGNFDWTYFSSSSNRHIQIIGLYLKWKQIKIENEAQLRPLIKRNLRVAKDLAGYSTEKLQETWEYMDNKRINGKQMEWTLETTFKFVNGEL